MDDASIHDGDTSCALVAVLDSACLAIRGGLHPPVGTRKRASAPRMTTSFRSGRKDPKPGSLLTVLIRGIVPESADMCMGMFIVFSPGESNGWRPVRYEKNSCPCEVPDRPAIFPAGCISENIGFGPPFLDVLFHQVVADFHKSERNACQGNET